MSKTIGILPVNILDSLESGYLFKSVKLKRYVEGMYFHFLFILHQFFTNGPCSGWSWNNFDAFGPLGQKFASEVFLWSQHYFWSSLDLIPPQTTMQTPRCQSRRHHRPHSGCGATTLSIWSLSIFAQQLSSPVWSNLDIFNPREGIVSLSMQPG